MMTVAQIFKAWAIFGGKLDAMSEDRARWLIDEVTCHPDYVLMFSHVQFYSCEEFRRWVELL